MQGRFLKPSFCLFALFCLLLAGKSVFAQQAVDTFVSVSFGGIRLNRVTNTFDATGSIKNISPDTLLLAPMWLVITSISDPTVTLANTAGSTLDGLPYLSVPLPGNTLSAGKSIENLVLKFSNPNKIAFTFQVNVRALLEGTPTGEPPSVYITSPVNGSEFKTATITVTGTVDNPQAAVSVNGVNAVVLKGRFTAKNVPLPHDGALIITAIATDAAGHTGQASTTVQRDTHPPSLAIDSPGTGFQTSDAIVSIAGTVSDVVSAHPSVTVNGVPAMVINSSFIAMNLPLQVGANAFTATATDDVGNTRTTQITVTRVASASFMLSILGGQAQTALVKTTLPQPLTVQFTDAAGTALANRELIFQVSRGDGTLESNGTSGRKLFVTTDGNGMASAAFTLGSRSGAGNNRVSVMLEGGIPSVDFCATSTSGVPVGILATPMTSQQFGVVNRPLASPFMANVFDALGNPAAGIPVTFTVTEGGGSLSGKSTCVVTTGPDGVAAAVLTLGPNTGILNNTVTATYNGQTTPALPFTASGRIAGAPGNTTFSGLIRDNLERPLVHAHVFFAGMSQSTYTDSQGRFTLINVTPGGQQIVVDSSMIQDAQGIQYNGVALNANIISGIENRLVTPIYLPPMPSSSQFSATITGTVTQPVVIPMPGVSEMTLILLSGTIVSNEKGPASPANPITITSSRVNNNRVPMTLPNGASFQIAGAVAPHGVTFNPPAAISVPNTGYAPGTITDIYNFDHEVGRYVSIGLATVSPDGSHVISNPGFGIAATGWWGFPAFPPLPVTEVKNCLVTLTVDKPVVIPGEFVTFVATVTNGSPGGVLQWKGDLGDSPSIIDNVVVTKYSMPGKHTVTASFDQSFASASTNVLGLVEAQVRKDTEPTSSLSTNHREFYLNNAIAAHCVLTPDASAGGKVKWELHLKTSSSDTIIQNGTGKDFTASLMSTGMYSVIFYLDTNNNLQFDSGEPNVQTSFNAISLMEAQVKEMSEPDSFYDHDPGVFCQGDTIAGYCKLDPDTVPVTAVRWVVFKIGFFFDSIVASGPGKIFTTKLMDSGNYRVVFYYDVNSNGNFDSSEQNVQTEKFEVQEVKIQYLTFSHHVDVMFNNADVDSVLAAANALLRKRDRKSLIEDNNDLRCCVQLMQTGSLMTFGTPGSPPGTPPADIATDDLNDPTSDASRVFQEDGDIKIVRSYYGGTLGLTKDFGILNIIIVQNAPVASWAHEYGHAKGLRHPKDDPAVGHAIGHRIMDQALDVPLGGTRNTVSQAHSDAFRR